MSQVTNNQKEQTTPSLYSFYGKQYDYNDLAQAADQGLNEYLATLKRGEKDAQEFQNAYSNIMSGIKDGTITFDNGHFHDSKGRYTNAEKKNKDYYGLIANYIYNKMGKSNVYEAPKDTSKIDWDSNSVKTALMRQLFNSDTGNIKDFLELDEEKNGVRGIAKRSAYLADALQSVANNWDNTFSGYQDDDKSKYVTLLTNAAAALRDGKIDPGDYLALSKAVGGMDFRSMMYTGAPQTSVAQSTNPQAAQPATSQTPLKTKHASLNDNSYNTQMLSRISSVMSRVPTNGLINILRNSFYNRYYKFGNDRRIAKLFGTSNISSKAGVTATLYAMQSQGMLRKLAGDNDNLFYIRGLNTKKGTGWVWDKINNTVTEMPLDKIQLAKTPTMNKQGGILKMSRGGTSPQQPFYTGLVDFDQNKYQRKWGSQQYGMDASGNFLNTPFTTGGAGYNKDKYSTDPNHRNFTQKGRDAALAIENSQNYKNQTARILSDYDAWNNASDKSTFNDENNLFLRYTHGYDKQQTNDANKFWNNNALRTSWGPSGKNYYGQTTAATNNVRDRINNLRNDQQVSIGHNNYRASGDRFFYKDSEGKSHYVDPTVAKSGKYTLSNEGTKVSEGDTDWTDYELTGLSNSQQTGSNGEKTEGTDINRTNGSQKTDQLQKGLRAAQDLAPQALALTRLTNSIRTNNRIADTMKKATSPVLKDTYELYSPVTGAFSEMQFRNQQAADLRRQASKNATNDAGLNNDQVGDTNLKATTEVVIPGHIIDDQAAKKSQAEQLRQIEGNKSRESEAANYNRAALAQYKKEIGTIEAQRQNANYNSKNNYYVGLESELRQKNAQRDVDERSLKSQYDIQLSLNDTNRQYALREKQMQRQLQYALNDKRLAYEDKLEKWKADNPDATNADLHNQQFYKDYIAETRQLQSDYDKNADSLAQEQSIATRQMFDRMREKMGQSALFSKRGGKLSLNSINLLNKVIR